MITRVRIRQYVMIHGGRYGSLADPHGPSFAPGWCFVKMDGDKARGQWFAPSQVQILGKVPEA
jgi:hypothetical protein